MHRLPSMFMKPLRWTGLAVVVFFSACAATQPPFVSAATGGDGGLLSRDSGAVGEAQAGDSLTPSQSTIQDPQAPQRAAPIPAGGSDSRYGPSRQSLIYDVNVSLLQDTIQPPVSAPGTASEGTNSTIYFNPNLGYMLTDNVEIGAGVAGTYRAQDIGDDLYSLTARVYGNYIHRATNRLWLQAGPELGVQFTDAGPYDFSGNVYGLQGGVRYWVGPNVAMSTMLSWRHLPDQESVDPFTNQTNTFDSNVLALTLGFSVSF